MENKRTKRLNSLLKEVISEVIRSEVRNPDVSELLSVMEVDISKDLHHAKVYISVIGTEEEKTKTIEALQSAAGYISFHASKKVVMRHFPSLNFMIDETVEKQMHIDALLQKIKQQQDNQNS